MKKAESFSFNSRCRVTADAVVQLCSGVRPVARAAYNKASTYGEKRESRVEASEW